MCKKPIGRRHYQSKEPQIVKSYFVDLSKFHMTLVFVLPLDVMYILIAFLWTPS